METYKFDIEIIVPGFDGTHDYIEFELELTGAACMCEVDGGEMRKAIIVHEAYHDCTLFDATQNEHIKNWITANDDAINKMFAEKYKDFDNFYD